MENDKVVIVASTTKDSYGNLRFVDGDGAEHKVGSKRSALFPFVEQSVGHEIRLKYQEYKGISYIAEVEPVDAPAVVKAAVKMGAVVDKVETVIHKDGKNRGFALSYAKDIGVAKINMDLGYSDEETIARAKTFEIYLETGE